MTTLDTKTPVSTPTAVSTVTPKPAAFWRNVSRYLIKRLLTLGAAVVAAVYLTILIANLGGYVDTIVAARIEEQVGFMLRGGWMSDLPPEERMARAEETILAMQDAAGLNDPFLLRTARWLGDGLTLNWGSPERAWQYGLDAADMEAIEIVAENMARTLLVFGTANLFLFITAVLLALVFNRRHGGWLDRTFILLSPISSAPAWVFGVLLSTFLLRVFGFSPGGTLDTLPTGDLRWIHIRVILRNLLLPFLAIFLAGLFQSTYTWRSFFQVYRHEDYVEMAQAKGLSNGRIDRNYVIRPALPALLTSFALLLAVLWQEIIALEYFFNVQGLGRLFVSALTNYDTTMIVAIVTTFAYLIAITVLVLEICYALVDPRVRVGSQQKQQRQEGRDLTPFWQRLRFWRRRRRSTSPVTTERASKNGRARRIRPAISPQRWLHWLKRTGQRASKALQAMRQYPSAIAGLIIIAGLIGVSIYTVIALPYSEAIPLWRGDDNVWLRNPRSALPTWVNVFRANDLPPTISLSASEADTLKEVTEMRDGLRQVSIPFTFNYDYGDFPQDVIIDISATYAERGPHVAINWVWPDGRERELTSFQPGDTESYFVSRDERLERRLQSDSPEQAIFLGEAADGERPLPGDYTLQINVIHFEPDSELDATVTILGQVYGLAGTDDQRRDLMIALLWGTPVALAFGLIAAVATSFGGMFVAALGAWYGGIVDRIVEFFTEVNLILPFFPVSLMVFVLYSRSIVTILAVTVALTIFGSAVKTYRATFLQIRTAPYVEAARAYGASNLRIVTRYMLPRIATVLLPRLIILVPSYVFLEATLAFLGVSDPVLPTWGKLVVSALSYGVQTDATHLVVAPLGLLFVTGFAFAMVGIALERIFEPKLREM